MTLVLSRAKRTTRNLRTDSVPFGDVLAIARGKEDKRRLGDYLVPCCLSGFWSGFCGLAGNKSAAHEFQCETKIAGRYKPRHHGRQREHQNEQRRAIKEFNRLQH